MIQIHQLREKDGEKFEFDREDTMPDALKLLVEAELAFGASITEASDTRLVITTEAFACKDTTVFVGTADDIRPLLAICGYYLEACARDEEVMDGVMQQLDALPDGWGRRRGYLELALPMVVGGNRLKMALMLGLNFEADDIKTGMAMRRADLHAAIALMHETNATFSEVVS